LPESLLHVYSYLKHDRIYVKVRVTHQGLLAMKIQQIPMASISSFSFGNMWPKYQLKNTGKRCWGKL